MAIIPISNCQVRVDSSRILPHSQSLAQLSIICNAVKWERDWYIFSCEWRHRQGKLRERGCHVNLEQLCPHARTRAQLSRVERWQHTMTIFVPLHETVGKTVFVKTHSNVVVVLAHVQFLSSLYSWRHSHEKMYQALSHLTVLQVMRSWVRAWERG